MNKPKFDPSKPFSPVDEKPAFDPSKPFSPVDEVPENNFPKSPGEMLLPAIAKGAEYVDRYTGAPTRAGLMTGLQTGSPIAGLKAYGKQFGEPTDLAPTGKDIAAQVGLSSEEKYKIPFTDYKFSPAGAAGIGIDTLASPDTLLPIGKMAQLPLKAVGPAIRGAEEAGSLLSKGLQYITKKAGTTLTGLPEKQIETYIKRRKEINGLIKQYGSDIATASDDVRNGFLTQIQNAKGLMNKQIGSVLEKSSPVSKIKVDSVLENLEKTKSKLNTVTKAQEIQEIDEMIDTVHKLAPNGEIDVKNLFDLKEFMQDRAKGSYMKNGQFFAPGKSAQQASKGAAAEARKVLNKASPEIASANNKLSALHKAEEKITKNLITPGKPEGSLITAGSGQNRQSRQLQNLESITGAPMTKQAENLAAQSAFAKPGFLPTDTTGKSLTRMATGAAAGGLLGGAPGAMIGGALSSPAALKQAINIGGGAANIGRGLANKARAADIFLQTPAGEKALAAALRAGRITNAQSKNKKDKKDAN